MSEDKDSPVIKFPTPHDYIKEHADKVNKELDDWFMFNILSRVVVELADPKSVFGKQIRILLQEKNDETDSSR